MIYILDANEAQETWYVKEKPTIAIRCRSSQYCIDWFKKLERSVVEYKPLRDEGNYADILELTFDDLGYDKSIVKPRFPGDYERTAAFRNSQLTKQGFSLFNGLHALEIIKFLKKNEGKFKHIMVNCESGESRSPAIALTLQERLGGEIWTSSQFGLSDKNKLVYQRMNTVFDRRWNSFPN